MFRSHALKNLRALNVPHLKASPRKSSGCRPRLLGQRRWASNGNTSSSEQPIYITTPIFYVNAAPHIGHLYTMVLADVMKRWQMIQGRSAYLCTGTDEHGMKIQRAAAKERMDPQEFCDNNSIKFLELAAAANVEHDFYIRTTDERHKQAVATFWLQLKTNLPEEFALYKGSHEGWYCVSDECFYPESLIKSSIVPQTGKKIFVNVETENEVEWIKEDTWFFPLSKFKTALLEFYDANPDWIVPKHRMNEIRHWVENHLEDLSVTRPASRISWGIRDPDDESQTIYIWVDALVNYITEAGYGTKWFSPEDDMGLWPASLHVIGKDILRFHAVYWPAFLMALNLPLPRRILCHNHWTMSNRKMSKSLGNVVNPTFALQRWDVDPLRYFLMRDANLTKDMSYSNQTIASVYFKELQASLGNLVYRVSRPKVKAKWSTAEAVQAFRQKRFQRYESSDSVDEKYRSLEGPLQRVTEAFSAAMENCNTAEAIREIHELLRETNRYVSDTEPWFLVRGTEDEMRTLLNYVIFTASEAIRIAAILLQPIMPSKASVILDELGVNEQRRTVQYARKGQDDGYGRPSSPSAFATRVKKWEAIFPPTPTANVSDEELLVQIRSLFHSKTKNKMNQMAELLAMESREGVTAVQSLLARTQEKSSDEAERR